MLKKAIIGIITVSLSLGMVACGDSNSNQTNANKANEGNNVTQSDDSATQAEPQTKQNTNDEIVINNNITHYDGVSEEEFSEAEKATIAFIKNNLNIDAKELSDVNKLNELVNNMFSNFEGNNVNNAKENFMRHVKNVVLPNEQKTNITKINLNDVDRESDGIEIEGFATVKVDKFSNKKEIEGTEQKVEFSVTTQNGKIIKYDIDDLVDEDDD